MCRVIGWEPDGRVYQRLEESFDRIAGTTLKFKDAWWDKGEKEWKSQTFHLIERVNLCTRGELDRKRHHTGRAAQKLCSFVWSDVIWKSFQDGFIKTLDMNLFRRIARGPRKEVPLRLFRILDKRFHFGNIARLKLGRLCLGTLGLSPSYGPFEMFRVLERAADWLVECGFLSSMHAQGERLSRDSMVVFTKARAKTDQRAAAAQTRTSLSTSKRETLDATTCDDEHRQWLLGQEEATLVFEEGLALEARFGSELERKLVLEQRSNGVTVRDSGRIRTEYVRRFIEAKSSNAA